MERKKFSDNQIMEIIVTIFLVLVFTFFLVKFLFF